MEIQNVSYVPQSTPSFGMALRINKGAEKFINELPADERAYLRALGRRISGSRHNIDIDADGKVTNALSPRTSDVSIVPKSELDAPTEAEKLLAKRVSKEMTWDEKLEIFENDIETFLKVLKIKMSFWKSKFMRRLQVAEARQSNRASSEAWRDVVRTRLGLKDEMAAKDTKSLMSEFGPKSDKVVTDKAKVKD